MVGWSVGWLQEKCHSCKNITFNFCLVTWLDNFILSYIEGLRKQTGKATFACCTDWLKEKRCLQKTLSMIIYFLLNVKIKNLKPTKGNEILTSFTLPFVSDVHNGIEYCLIGYLMLFCTCHHI